MTTLNEEICEFIGAFIGDGFSGIYNRKKTQYLIGFVGHRELDKEYFYHFLHPCIKRNFPFTNPRLFYRESDNTIRIIMYSRKLFSFLKDLGFKGGKKSDTVIIPAIIAKNDKFLCATLRGIFNTDGSVFFDKRPAYKDLYPRIDLHLENKRLISQIYSLLKKLGIKATITTNQSKIQINGKKNIASFLNKVGFTNERHLSKIRKIEKAPGVTFSTH